MSKVTPLPLPEQWALGKKASAAAKGIVWSQLRRSGTNDLREDRPNLFYPIIFNKSGNKIISVGEVLDLKEHPKAALEDKGDSLWLWPIKESGIEGNWQISPSEVIDRLNKGYIKIGKRKEHTIPVSYLKRGSIKKIENEEVSVIGYDEHSGTVIVDASDYSREFVPGSQWNIESHDATYHGSQLLNKILGEKRFDFPKSLYAVRDTLGFFVANNKDAIVVDFFSGSGTTMHAVNLLNKEYGGNRRCIMVTNNEVSEAEAKSLSEQGYKKGDPEWETLGIAQYVTYPRTVCSIEGKDVNGNLIKGNYITSSEKEIPISEGFISNVKYLKCDWTSRKPEDYLLSNVLCLHIKEMIELQNGYEIDGIKNVLILTKDDFNKAILNTSIYEQIENIWLNQNMILNAEEMKLLTEKGFKYIPREFFGRELREAAE